MLGFDNLDQKEKIEIILVLIIIILGIVGYVFFKDYLIRKEFLDRKTKEQNIIEQLTAPEKEMTAEEKARKEEIKKDLTAPANSKSKISEEILKSLTAPK